MAETDKPKKPRGLFRLFKPDIPEPPKKAKEIDSDFLKTALERAQSAYERERQNMLDAYEDLEFRAGDQWPQYARAAREKQKRPILTINRIPQFVRQVTGDIRLMKPAIKAVPVDSRGTTEVAELISGMIRYIENRSESQSAYGIGADSQVTAGIGHWRVTTEYAEETTFNQEIRITQIDDGVSVLWDPDAILPTREDAMWCIVPVDMSRQKFKEAYPDVPVEEFASYDRRYGEYWYGADFVRVGEYWEKRPAKRLLALLPDGGIDDLTDADDEDIAALKAQGARVEERDGHKIFRSLITIGNVLEEPEEWAGRMIPIVPVIGEEVRIGRKVVRHGIVRFAKDAQRMYNYMRSTQTEGIALTPKAPWIGTEKNFEENLDMWMTANEENWPYLPYTPDPLNGGAAPQRNMPAMTSPGLTEAVMMADNDMKAVTGIYDASLGNRSNETSGVAIKARQQEGDVGTVAYVQNFSRSIRHTGRILVDLIPHVYDTERQIQVMGEDGKVDTLAINKAVAPDDLDDEVEEPIDLDGRAPVDNEPEEETPSPTSKPKPKGKTLNDVTIGAYGITVETGPSYTTKREAAQDGMAEFIRSAPQVAPVILDLFAKAQDWPMANEIAERLETLLPPPIKALLAQKKQPGEIGPNGPAGDPAGDPALAPPPVPPPPPPDPTVIAKAQADIATSDSKVKVAQIEVAMKQLELELRKVELLTKQAEAAGKAHANTDALAQVVQEMAKMRGMVDQLADDVHGAPAAPDQGGAPSGGPEVAPLNLNAVQPQMEPGA